MDAGLEIESSLPEDGTEGVLIGRAWKSGALAGPSVIVLQDDAVVDITGTFPTVTH